MDREYIKIGKVKSIPLDMNYPQLKTLDDAFWLENAFYGLLDFYKNHDKTELKNKYEKSNAKERVIAKYIRRYLNNQPTFNNLFKAVGENTNDEEIEGNYDITIISSLWSSNFHLECKNLSTKQDSINKYVYYKRNSSKPDGGIYRYFNGKYGQSHSFGGMLGFVLQGETTAIKTRIIDKIENTPFDNIPEGDLIRVEQNSIAGNDFTFNTIHNRNNKEFLIYHLLFDLQ